MLPVLPSMPFVDGECTRHKKRPEPYSRTHHMTRGNTMDPGNGTAELSALSDERANPWAQPLFARAAAVVPEEPSHPFCTCQGRHHLHRSAETDQRRADGPAFLCTYDLLARRFPAIPTATPHIAILATQPEPTHARFAHIICNSSPRMQPHACPRCPLPRPGPVLTMVYHTTEPYPVAGPDLYQEYGFMPVAPRVAP